MDIQRLYNKECLKYLNESLSKKLDNGSTTATKLCANAALEGKLSIIAWALGQGYPIGKRVYINAVQKGHLHILDWLYENHRNFPQSKPIWTKVCRTAINSGNLVILFWAKQKGFLNNIPNLCEYCVTVGNPLILDWLIYTNYPSWGSPFVLALPKLKEKVCNGSNQPIIEYALKEEMIEELIWLQQKGKAFSSQLSIRSTLEYAVQYKLIKVLEWIYSQGHPLHTELFDCHLSHYLPDIVKWLHKHGCPWPTTMDYKSHWNPMDSYLHKTNAPIEWNCVRGLYCSLCYQVMPKRTWKLWDDTNSYFYWLPEEVVMNILDLAYPTGVNFDIAN